MNQQTAHEPKKQGWIGRLATAVAEKCFAWISQNACSISPSDAYQFYHHCGFGSYDGLAEAMIAGSLARMKWDEEV